MAENEEKEEKKEEKKEYTTYVIFPVYKVKDGKKMKSVEKWGVKNMGSDHVIKYFRTQAEAKEFVAGRAERNNRAAVTKASKGQHKGKFQK